MQEAHSRIREHRDDSWHGPGERCEQLGGRKGGAGLSSFGVECRLTGWLMDWIRCEDERRRKSPMTSTCETCRLGVENTEQRVCLERLRLLLGRCGARVPLISKWRMPRKIFSTSLDM